MTTDKRPDCVLYVKALPVVPVVPVVTQCAVKLPVTEVQKGRL